MINERNLAAYVSAVSAVEMFKAIATIPLHQSFSGYDPIDHLRFGNMQMTLEEMRQLKKVGIAREILAASAHMGERMGRKLAHALKADDLEELKPNEVLQKYIYELAQLLPIEERAVIGNLLLKQVA
jgi:hypothetical protein